MTDSAIPAEPTAATPPDIVDAAPPDAVRSNKLRAVFAGLLAALTIVAFIASVVSVWARGVLFNSSKVGHAVDAALQDPKVTDAASQYLTDQLFVVVDVNGYVVKYLPAPLERFAPAIVGGLQSRIEQRVNQLISLPATRRLIVGTVEQAHRTLMKLLEGDGLVHGITIKNGEVTVNLLPILGLALNQVHDLGLLQNVTLPALTLDGDPAQQIAALEKATGRNLPDHFGQLVVYRSDALAKAGDTLSNAQRALVLVKRAIVAILVLTLLLFVATVLVANHRRRQLAIMLLAGASVMVLTRAVIAYVVAKAPLLVVRPGARAALAASVKSLAGSLITIVTGLAILGLLVAIWLWLTGPSERARVLRGRAGAAGSSAGGLIAQHREASAIGAFAIATLVFLVAGFGVVQIVIAGLFALAGCWIYWGRRPTTTPPAAG